MTNEELLSKLVTFKTVYGNNIEEFTNCISFIKEYLSQNSNLFFKDFTFNDNKSLLVSNTKDNDYDVLFLGHLDVVPAHESQFIARIESDKMYARGAFDMKGHDAVMINIMRNLNTSKKIALILTTDEERGGFYGIPKIIEKNPFSSSLVIVPDGGNNFEIVTEEKGVLQLELTAKGKSAHSSKPYDGDNAIVKLMNLYNKLLKKYPLPKDENDFRTSINLGVISGGSALNIVPESAKMMLDIRHTYMDTKEKIINDIKNIDNSIKINIIAQGEAYKLNTKDKNVQKYIESCEKVLNKKIKYSTCESASDARFFEKYKMNAIIMNACGKDLHGKNEYIKLSSLDKLEKIYLETINNI